MDLDTLLQHREKANGLFLEYVGMIPNNLESLAQLALIGGRLDTLIRREVVRRRNPKIRKDEQ